jgi:purine-binding chemotaxis protein CheW
MNNSTSSTGIDSTEDIHGDAENELKYILFRIKTDLFASPLLSLCEVLKTPMIKAVPHTVAYFRGVANLRGRILSVIDLKTKLNMEPSSQEGGAFVLVFERGDGGLVGALVDEVIATVTIAKDEIDTDPLMEVNIPTDYLMGVALIEKGMVTIMDVAKCLTHEEWATIKNMK